jgi:hypothetical protein
MTDFKKWSREYLAAAKADNFAWFVERHAAPLNSLNEDLPEADQSTFETVCDLHLDIIVEKIASRPDRSEWAEKFLERQRYGLKDEDRGCAMEVEFFCSGAPPVGPVSLFLDEDELQAIPFTEICAAHTVGTIFLGTLKGEWSEDDAERLLSQLNRDIRFEGIENPVFDWWHEGNHISAHIDLPEL